MIHILDRDVDFEEAKASTDLEILFTYCVQRAIESLRIGSESIGSWKNAQEITRWLLCPGMGEDDFIEAWEDQSLMRELHRELGLWLEDVREVIQEAGTGT